MRSARLATISHCIPDPMREGVSSHPPGHTHPHPLDIPAPQKGPATRDNYPWKGPETTDNRPSREQTYAHENITFSQLHWWATTRKHSSRIPVASADHAFFNRHQMSALWGQSSSEQV